MGYLKRKDYNRVILSSFIDEITDNDYSIVEYAELSAIDTVKSYLSASYDVDKIFIDYEDYDEGVEYIEGDAVWYYNDASTSGEEDYMYVCKVDSIGNLPTDTDFWEKRDVRNYHMTRLVVDIVIFDLYSRISPKDVPELRGIRYDEAIKQLKNYMKGTNASQLPTLSSTTFRPLEDTRPVNDYKF
jgi:hypothetical protein